MEEIYLVWLHHIWISQRKLHKIFKNKENYKEVFNSINQKFLKKEDFKEKQIESILEKYKKINLENLKSILKERKVKIITIFDKNYPDNLKNISNPPFLFYLRWYIDNSPKIAVIGSRNMSFYWEKILEKIIPWVSNYFSIVSGWASWCDSKAHIETLKNNKKTISIIWTWIDIDYPASNKKLFDRIVNSWWAVISIFPIWEIWNPHNFPIRNEIIAWISKWILIVEAKEKSWTLITANLALEMWKDIFCIPWDIFKIWSLWTNSLIKKWEAKLVITDKDILEEYNISNQHTSENKNSEKELKLEKWEKEIYDLLLLEDLNIDDINKKINIGITEISNKISMMEISWVIYKNSSWKYTIK